MTACSPEVAGQIKIVTATGSDLHLLSGIMVLSTLQNAAEVPEQNAGPEQFSKMLHYPSVSSAPEGRRQKVKRLEC